MNSTHDDKLEMHLNVQKQTYWECLHAGYVKTSNGKQNDMY